MLLDSSPRLLGQVRRGCFFQRRNDLGRRQRPTILFGVRILFYGLQKRRQE